MGLFDFDNLLIWNWILFVIHLLLAIGLLIFFRMRETTNTNMDFAMYDINIEYDDDMNPIAVADKAVNSTTETIQYLIVIFFFVTALFHLFYATNAFGTGAYLEAVKNGNNYFRWVEYAISATIMIVIINLISGVKSLDSNFLAIAGSIIVMMQGDSVEKSLRRHDGNYDYVVPTVTGWVMLTAIFVVVIKNFIMRLKEARDAGFSIPSWIPGVLFPIIIWYMSFGITQLVQIFQGGDDYKNYEYTYLILSLTSKAFLGLYLAFGLTQRSDETDDQ